MEENMRRKDKQVSDKDILCDVINKAIVCRIGLVKNNRPYIIPLSFGFDGIHIYFHSAKSGEKVQILRENNNVCMEFEQDVKIIKGEKPCEWSARYLTVVVHGTAELVVDLIHKSYGLNQIFSHYNPGNNQYTFTNEELESVLVYKVTPIKIMGKSSGMKE
jgi:nitroimidazol reductase NimA-like FMN-containing flavoprotein (pyridoxamine 5'-phosphate oxidase superfamily)